MTEYTTGLFLRVQGAPKHGPAYDPKSADHPSVGLPCIGCGKCFAPGDITTLVVLGPCGDEEAQEKAAAGRFYAATCLELHWRCATGTVPMANGTQAPMAKRRD